MRSIRWMLIFRPDFRGHADERSTQLPYVSGEMMENRQLYQLGGLGLWVGAVVFVSYVVLRSFITAGVDPTVFAKHPLWVPIGALGIIGSVLVSLGLPALYAYMARAGGLLGVIGVVLIAIAWMFFSVFLSFYGMLIAPWLADKAPSLIAASAPLPRAFVIAFLIGMVTWFTGTVLLAMPFIRGRARPRWAGYMLAVSALWIVIGNIILAPRGPAANVAINLLSNLSPVLLLVALGYLGWRMWSDPGRIERLDGDPT